MDTYKIAIDTFLAETSECKASGTHHAFHPPCQHPEY